MNNAYKPQGFYLPPVVKNLLIINVILYLATRLLPGLDLTDKLGLHYFLSDKFRVYQFVTYMFMHDPDPVNGIWHIVFNMFGLYMFGVVLETYWGGKRFLTYYMLTGLGAAITHYGITYYRLMNTDLPVEYLNEINLIGASGAIYGILLAYGMLFPNSMLYLFGFVPMKAKFAVIAFGLLELYQGYTGGDNVAHYAHLGGIATGIIIILYWRKGGGKNSYYDPNR